MTIRNLEDRRIEYLEAIERYENDVIDLVEGRIKWQHRSPETEGMVDVTEYTLGQTRSILDTYRRLLADVEKRIASGS
ncbi:hypothetical protein D3C71_915810 [compost metagenome]